MTNKIIYFLIFLIIFLLGIFTTLFFREIRYTSFWKPTTDSISVNKAYDDTKNNPENYLFLDVRSEGEYNTAHAEGSTSYPIQKLYDNHKDLPLNKDKEIYLMCSGGSLAGVAFGYLEHQGFRNIKRITGGIKEWHAQALPMVSKNLFTEINNSSIEKSSDNGNLDFPINLNK
jgi:rhodanese-related sulfurtransferase